MEQKQTKEFITQTISLVGLLLGLAAAVFLINFIGQAFSTKIADWGSFGDYFGGIMNPVVACAALFLLAKSLRIQHKELSETRTALAKASNAQEEQVAHSKINARLEVGKMVSKRIIFFSSLSWNTNSI